ncbi:MAG: FG-GAP repeat protein, partial [Pseudomonadota bacterium]
MKNLIQALVFLTTPIIFCSAYSKTNTGKQAVSLSKQEWSDVIKQINGAGEIYQQNAYVKASNTNGGDQFGYSVAISGNTMVVGAVKEDSNATGVNNNQGNNAQISSGAAYVFTRNNAGDWSQQAYLKAS